MRHGLLSKCVVLPSELQEVFDALLEQHLSKLQPADGVEHGVIEEMVASVLRMRRLWAVETRLRTQAIANRPETTKWTASPVPSATWPSSPNSTCSSATSIICTSAPSITCTSSVHSNLPVTKRAWR